MPHQRAPGPRGLQLRDSLKHIRYDALTAYLTLHDRYGDVVCLPRFPHPLYLVRHPDAIQHILRDQAEKYCKGKLFQPIASIQGQGLLTSEGEFWRQRRRLIQPAFRQRQVDLCFEVIAEEAQGLVAGWRSAARNGQPVHVTAWLHRLAFRVVGRTLLGLDPSILDDLARQIEAIAAPLMRHLTSGGMRQMYMPTWLTAWTSQARHFRRALAAYHHIAQAIVDQRRQTLSLDPEAKTDLLARLIHTHDASGASKPQQQLRDEIITFIGAGVETSATALSWALYGLAQHPEINQRLQAEIDARLAGRALRPNDLAQLPYSRTILDETLRLYPPSAVLPRQANTLDDVMGYKIPRHALVLISPYVTHRHPGFWVTPERFDPERFTEEAVAKRHRFAYLPFGAGPRVCIGKSLALLEMHVVLVSIAQAYELKRLPDRPVQPALGATLHPRDGLWMTVHPRH